MTRAPRSFAGTTLVLLGLLTVAPQLRAQTRADLRYVGEPPVQLVYSVTDVTRREVMGTDSVHTAELSSVYHVELSTLDDAILARIAVRERTSAAGPLLQLPEPVELTISARGPYPDPTDERSLDAMMDIGPLLYLPGREVLQHESWTDTVTFVTERDGVGIKVRSILTGTYTGDTIVAGRTLNVVRFHSADIMATETPAATMTLIGSTSGGRRELVLWDPRRHVLVYREAEREASLEMETLTGPRTTLERSRVVLRLVQ